MLILNHYPFSVSSQKVRMVLAEKNIQWEDKVIDLMAGEQLSDGFLALHPKGEVPVLQHRNLVLSDSWYINEYLEEVFPERPLMPKSSYERYSVRTWNQWIAENIHKASGVISYLVLGRSQLLSMDKKLLSAMLSKIPSAQTRQWRENVIEKGYEAREVINSIALFKQFFVKIESSLKDSNSWLVGDDISLADITVFPYIFRAEHVGLDFLMSFSDFPKMRAWYLRMQSRESIQPSFMQYIDSDMSELLMSLVIDAQPKLVELARKL